jgi:PAS domain S-box-containing protein
MSVREATREDPAQRPDALLRVLVEGTSGETGLEFFRKLVTALAEALQADGAWVTEYLPEARRLRAIAFHLRGGTVPQYEYDIEGTPCGEALRTRDLVFISDRVLEVFPDEHDLRRLGASSYIGAPILDEKNEVILGHLGAFGVRPMPEIASYRQIFRLFTARATAELRRLRLEMALRARTEELEAVLQSAMDAILILNDERDIVRANQAAGAFFETDRLNGEMLDRFLSVDGAAKLEPILEQLASAGPGVNHVWIPDTFEARAASGRKFAAEGTLSRFEHAGRTFFTLILRNVSERLAAQQQIEQLSVQTAYLREEVERHFGEIVGESPPMRRLVQDIREVAQTDASVLITGETGTGKELVARAVHRASRRADMPLVKVNCAAIPVALMESEFFGHEKGAFTGATARREGRFALAHGGSIFLDEIGELPLELQPKLLRVLQEGEFEPVGSNRVRKVDVRVIAATNRDLRLEASAGRFREDLYYRLSVFPLHVPALRQRGNDVALLAHALVRRFSARHGRKAPVVSEADLHRLRSYRWPGNVRELSNVIERALITGSGMRLDLDRALPPEPGPPAEAAPATVAPDATRVWTARELEELEAANVRRALQAAGGRISGEGGAAALLGIKPSTLTSRLKALGLR